MPVISPDGVVGNGAARRGRRVDVLLVGRRGSGIDVVDERTGARGFVRGTGDPIALRAARSRSCSAPTRSSVGDLLVTSGVGGVPAGHPGGARDQGRQARLRHLPGGRSDARRSTSRASKRCSSSPRRRATSPARGRGAQQVGRSHAQHRRSSRVGLVAPGDAVATCYRLLGHVHVRRHHADLVLPLIVFMGVHEYSVARGAALAFAPRLRCSTCSRARRSGSSPSSRWRSSSLSRAAGVRLAAQTMLTQLALAFVFALVRGRAHRVMLIAIFGRIPHGPRALAGAGRCRTPSRRRRSRRSSSASPSAPPGDHHRPAAGEGGAVSLPRSSARTSASSGGASAGWRSVMVAPASRRSSCASSSSRCSRATTTAPMRATTSSDGHASRRRAASFAIAQGKVLAASRPVVQRLRRPRAARHERRRGRSWSTTSASALDERARLEQQARRDPSRRRAPQESSRSCSRRTSRATSSRRLETHAAELRGVDVVPVPVRYYPYDESARTSLGYMAEVDAETLAALQALGLRRGRSHRRDRRRARLGELPPRHARLGEGPRRRARVATAAPGGEGIIEEPRRLDPVPGRDLRLTLDATSQQAIEQGHARRARRAASRSSTFAPAASSGSSPSRATTRTRSRAARAIEVIRRRVPAALRRIRSSPRSTRPCPARTRPARRSSRSRRWRRSRTSIIDPRAQDAVQRASTRSAGASSSARTCTALVDLHEAIVQSCNVYFYHLAEYGVGMDRHRQDGAWTSASGRRRARRERRGRGAHADPRLDDASPQGPVPRRLHAQRGDRPGRDDGDRASARARVRRARQRRHALPAADRARGRDERRHRRAGVSAARPPAARRSPREPLARRRRASRRA